MEAAKITQDSNIDKVIELWPDDGIKTDLIPANHDDVVEEAFVDRIAFIRDVVSYERSVMLNNIVKLVTAVVILASVIAGIACVVSSDVGSWAFTSYTMFFLGCYALEASFAAEIGIPKLPEGVTIFKNRYVITDPEIHPGNFRVTSDNAWIFGDGRCVKVRPWTWL